MRLGLEQSIRPDLQLRLSPQLLQRIEVLQLAGPDLAQMIEQELQENDALEQDSIDAERLDESEAEPTEAERLEASSLRWSSWAKN